MPVAPSTVMPRAPSSLLALTAVLVVVAACSSRTASDAGGCVDIELSSAELSCTTDQDCALVATGEVCPGYVPQRGNEYGTGTLCDNAAANSVGVAKVAAQLASIPTGNDGGDDFCDAVPGTPRCLGGQCGVCESLSGNGPPYSGPAGCADAGAAADGG